MERGEGHRTNPIEYQEQLRGIEQNIKEYMKGSRPDSIRGQAFNHRLVMAKYYGLLNTSDSPTDREANQRHFEEKQKEIEELERDEAFKQESTQIQNLITAYREAHHVTPESIGLPASAKDRVEKFALRNSTTQLMRIGADVNLEMVQQPRTSSQQ